MPEPVRHIINRMEDTFGQYILPIISPIVGGVFAYIAIWNLVQFIKTFSAVSWPKVQGTILESSITEDDNSYEAIIWFSYMVNDELIVGETPVLNSLWRTNLQAKYLTNTFKKYDIVDVSYNPNKPNEATLITGFSRLHINAILVMLFCGFFAYIFLYNGFNMIYELM